MKETEKIAWSSAEIVSSVEHLSASIYAGESEIIVLQHRQLHNGEQRSECSSEWLSSTCTLHSAWQKVIEQSSTQGNIARKTI